MNRVIHRSWGERSANIFLDLSLFIFPLGSFVRSSQAGIQLIEIRSHEKIQRLRLEPAIRPARVHLHIDLRAIFDRISALHVFAERRKP